jgi:hypothetical protein
VVVFHLKAPHMKHEENSVRGVKRAKALGDSETDLDMCITKADPHCPRQYHPDGKPCRGHIVGCHWAEPMIHDGFVDPLHKLDPHTRVDEMTLQEVLRLRARTGRLVYRVCTIETLLGACAKYGRSAVLEPKGDKRFDLDWPWEHIKDVADDLGVHVRSYALPANASALPAARRNGVPAKEIKK